MTSRTIHRKFSNVFLHNLSFRYAFKVMHAYLKLFKKQLSAAELTLTERDARRCVILAIKAVDVINFEELVDLQAIKQLTGTN